MQNRGRLSCRCSLNLRAAYVLALAVVACSNKREDAVRETLTFAEKVPYTLGTRRERFGGFTIAVKDSALVSYNRVFAYFEPKDTSRSTVYGALPLELLTALPVTRLEKLSSNKVRADTLQVTAIFDRPDAKLFEETVLDLVFTGDSVQPSPAQRDQFQRSLTRIKQTLQEKDTAYFLVTEGPRIVKLRTASQIRDSVTLKKRVDASKKEFSRVVSAASFLRLTASDYSILASRGLDGGGSVQGLLDPGPTAWPKESDVFGILEVACEARNGDNFLGAESYVNFKKLLPREIEKFLCVWFGEDARKWNDLKPKTFRVRLLGHAGRDTVAGPWIDVPGHAR